MSLADIAVGDIIIGVSALGRLRPLLVYRTSPAEVFTRLITSQSDYVFSRDGRSLRTGDGEACTIVSTAPLTPEDRKTALALDQKMGRARALTDLRLAPNEIELISKLSNQFRGYLSSASLRG